MARKIHWSLLALTALSGCGAPFGDKLAIDYEKKQIAGSIMVSDAKLYRREALINERRREVNYIDTLMAETEKVDFAITPDIIREVEIIQSLALSAGISFDPAAGLSYRDSSSNAAIQQKITALGLQMQLDQLERDATLFRAGLEKQTELANKDVGKLADPIAPVAAPTLTQADTSALVARIDGLQKTLADRLGATVGGPRPVSLKGNPIDQFRDRAAYRQVLTTARNAASLDELHDRGGAALYRLSFEVTTLPPEKDYRRTAGIVQMSPDASTIDADEMQEIFSQWLQYINGNLSTAGTLPGDETSIADFSVANRMATPMQLVVPANDAEKNAGTCSGIFAFDDKTVYKNTKKPNELINCSQKITFFIPNIQVKSTPDNRIDVLIHQFSSTQGKTLDDFFTTENAYSTMRSNEVRKYFLNEDQCTISRLFESRVQGQSVALKNGKDWLEAAITTAVAVPVLGPVLDKLAMQFAKNSDVSKFIRTQQGLVRESGQKAAIVLRVLAPEKCESWENLVPKTEVFVPTAFSNLVKNKANVRVYEVGPREQVQQVSTAARAAEAFSLALALTAKAPQAGTAANAGLGYSRSAVGKVDVIERQPIVIGYAQAGDDSMPMPSAPRDAATSPADAGSEPNKPSKTAKSGAMTEAANERAAAEANAKAAAAAAKLPKFGWILGPRIDSIDPKKSKLQPTQGLKPYDLSVDLSVSGWRTRLPLQVRTAWAPAWRTGALDGAMNVSKSKRTINVALAPSAAEFAELTRMLAFGSGGGSVRYALVRSVQPRSVKSCAASTLVIIGTGLWRTSDVVLGATRIGAAGITVLPDMSGISVEIPKSIDLGGKQIDLQLLTPYGVVQSPEPLLIDGYDGKGCEAVGEPKSPNVKLVSPTVINHSTNDPMFILTGSDLEKINKVTLGIAEGKLETVKAGAKTRKVTFLPNDVQRIGTEYESLTVYSGKDSKDIVTTQAIRLSILFSSSNKD
ncbi:MAG: hypothetical protein CFE37_10640 [Alphaproteobacteria bacterium PA4]|nr:MAG: hypothetical protein CFE37_10640 [Alphaproteobacteria bacterium PA4]